MASREPIQAPSGNVAFGGAPGHTPLKACLREVGLCLLGDGGKGRWVTDG